MYDNNMIGIFKGSENYLPNRPFGIRINININLQTHCLFSHQNLLPNMLASISLPLITLW
ncbi:hypothetical protein HanIR_Chr06g0264841 [Helianthus annuus]|nr:hypothetical protein HanIR_Chr06g0264841 [Helianthus annuus]